MITSIAPVAQSKLSPQVVQDIKSLDKKLLATNYYQKLPQSQRGHFCALYIYFHDILKVKTFTKEELAVFGCIDNPVEQQKKYNGVRVIVEHKDEFQKTMKKAGEGYGVKMQRRVYLALILKWLLRGTDKDIIGMETNFAKYWSQKYKSLSQPNLSQGIKDLQVLTPEVENSLLEQIDAFVRQYFAIDNDNSQPMVIDVAMQLQGMQQPLNASN